MTNGQDRILQRPRLAMLVWTVPVRLIDVSRGGCRLDSARPLETGVSGQLSLSLDGRTHQDDVRIARCQQREGAGRRFVLGAELLHTRRMDGCSIRLAISELVGEHVLPPEAQTINLKPPDRESEQLVKGVSRAPPATVNTEM